METTPNPTATHPLKQRRTRSPSYPAVSLSDAIEKARVFWEHEKRHSAPIDAVAKDWNYDAKSSAVPLTVAALRKYGLLEDVGPAGKQRQFKLTESALKIILNEEGNPERQWEIKEAALRPNLHRELWTKYGEQLPSDQTLQSWLLLDKKFNPASVSGFIKTYKETISFAKLTSSDIITDTQPDPEDLQERDHMNQTTELPKPGTGTGGQQIGSVREFAVPLPSGAIAAFKIPFPMTEEDFQQYSSLLEAYKTAVVKKEDKE